LQLGGANTWQLNAQVAREAFELPSLMTAQQDTWHRTASLWRDRATELRDAPAGEEGGRLSNVWLKAVGDFSKRDADNEVEYKQHVYSLQAGADHEYALDDQTRLVAGLLGGYVRSDLDFDGTSSNATFEGGTLGAYTSLLRGKLHIDLLLKSDILKLDYNGGRPDTKGDTSALAVGGAIDVGYRIDLGQKLFLEPNARLGYVRSSIDEEEIGGTAVEWKDGENLRGELGVRLGASHVTGGGLELRPFAEAGLLHDFTGDNVTDVGGFEARDDAGGEVRGKLGAGIAIGGTGGLSGFLGGDAHVGNDIQGGAVKGGITYRF
ncbi:autotransporter outer membrane beta-barrel domain-containing protein, partial [Marinimicrococcus flavescens]|nr:autotransporter outer membrane beta-barrel domain-containing protein [Marinimicrococcus flavescens]